MQPNARTSILAVSIGNNMPFRTLGHVVVTVIISTASVGCGRTVPFASDLGAVEFNIAAIDHGDFSAFDDASQLKLNLLMPAKPYTYWEWVSAHDNVEVVAAGGQIGRTMLEPKLRSALDDALNWDEGGVLGFARICAPDCCFQYVASVEGEDVQKWINRDGVREFLGEIDTAQDAILLIQAGDDIIEVESIGAIDDGFSLLVRTEKPGEALLESTKLLGTDRDCGILLNIYRELLHISRTGDISVVARKLVDQYCLGMP